MPETIFLEASEEVIVTIYADVVQQKQVETNMASITTAQFASIVSGMFGGEPIPPKELLPFDLDESYPELDEKTAIIFVEVRDMRMIPPNVMSDICAVPNFYETICKRAKQDG